MAEDCIFEGLPKVGDPGKAVVTGPATLDGCGVHTCCENRGSSCNLSVVDTSLKSCKSLEKGHLE